MSRGVITGVLLVFCNTVDARSLEDAPTQPNWPDQSGTMLGNLYGYLSVGAFKGSDNTGQIRTANYKGGSRIPWGLGIGYHLNKHISIDGGIEYWGERYERISDSILPGTANNFIQIDSVGLSFTSKYQNRYQNVNGYVGVGAGYFSTTLWVAAPSGGLLTTSGGSDDYIFGYHFVLGGGYRISKESYLGVELRHRIATVDFGEYSNGEVDAGGTSISLVWYGL